MATGVRWLARVPLAAVAGGCFAGILSAEAGWALLWATLPAALTVLLLSRQRWKLAAGFAAWTLFWSVHGPRLDRQEAAGQWAQHHGRAEVTLEGTVLSLRDRGGFLPRALFRIDDSERNPADLRRAVIGVRGLPDEVKPGDSLLLRGSTYPRGTARNPGEFDRQDWMRTRGIAAEMRADHHEIVALPKWHRALHRFAWELRLELRERIVAGLDEEAASASLIRGLVLGDRSSGGAELYGAFRQSGTMHVFAVSGLHVGLVGFLAWILMRICRVPRTWGLWAVLIIMWSYAFVTGLRPPALRASLMASVFLLGFAVKRQPSLANSLFASIPVVLLLDSFQLRQAGFQLSYVVVGMIILLAPLLYRRVQFMVDGDPFLPRVLYTRPQHWMQATRQKVIGLLVVSLAAWLGSMPLIGYHFGIVTPAAVLASMLLIPIVFAILSLALLGVVVGLVAAPLEETANRLNGHLAGGAHAIAVGFAAVPGSHFELNDRSDWAEGLLVFDLWYGNGAIYGGAGEGVLIDAGAEYEYRRVIAPALRQAGLTPRSLVLTHPDGGHVGGLGPALKDYDARQLLLPVREAGSPSFRKLLEVAEERACRVALGAEKAHYPLGKGVTLEVLRVADREHGSRADDRCMVMRLHWQGWRVLITGDAGLETERELLESGVDLQSDVWIMGRHGSDYTGTIEFVQAVGPQVIVAGEESYPPVERIPDWWAEAITQAGIDLWRQTETGAVMMKFSREEMELRSFADRGKRVILERE